MKGFGLDDAEMRPRGVADHGPLFGPPPASGAFAGAVYEPDRDDARLTGQMERIWSLMRDGRWRTIQEISAITGDPENSVSAQMRHLRKPQFGSHAIAKRVRAGSTALYEYRVAS